MTKFGKRINPQKKFKKFPSSQTSGMPLQSIKTLSTLSGINYHIKKNCDFLSGLPPIQSTGDDYPIRDGSAYNAAVQSSFYVYLINNAITRTTAPINKTATTDRIDIVATGVDNVLRQGDSFYIYHPITFKSKRFTCERDLDGTATTLRSNSASYQRGRDNFPSGSLLVKDAKVATTWRTTVPIGSSSTTYLWYLPTVNNWYSSSAYLVSLGTTIGSEYDSTALRSCEYVATRDCTIHTITIAFYLTTTSDLEFLICKVPLVDNSTSDVSLTAMIGTDNNGSYTANTNYVKTFDITGGNTLTQGEGVAVLARSTDDSGVRIYGRGFIEIELQ
tara:strand:- start:493 stop:1488 length:996 start_codon:yes stop_codon:yes gene_type:complete